MCSERPVPIERTGMHVLRRVDVPGSLKFCAENRTGYNVDSTGHRLSATTVVWLQTQPAERDAVPRTQRCTMHQPLDEISSLTPASSSFNSIDRFDAARSKNTGKPCCSTTRCDGMEWWDNPRLQTNSVWVSETGRGGHARRCRRRAAAQTRELSKAGGAVEA